ncbi:MAG: helix-turn-helix domain-containing protein [Candidatus Rhabdochlamydia sp.]|jgi:transcriptional regulator with XRE-family HTH domain|nr:cro/C1-type protein [Patescibacteria group bacterium]
MPLIILEEAIQLAYENLESKDFSEMIRELRNAIGLKLYKAAELIGIAPARLKNLETGYFRIMPKEIELNVIAQLYDIEVGTVKSKAQEHVKQRLRAKKVRLNEKL